MQEIKGRSNVRSLKDFKLSTLLELTNAINNNLPEERLFATFEYILKDQLNIGKAAIYLRQDNEWKIPLKYGIHKADLILNIEEELRAVSDITVLDTGDAGSNQSFDVVIPIYHQSSPLAYLFLGDLDEEARGASPIIKHLSFIQTLANITSVAVENKRLEREHIEQERVMQELHLASQMQEMLLPKVLPNNQFLQVAAHYKPHLEVGGDFYDIIQVSETETVFCMADVSGKGMAAAIIMANFQANLRANLKVERDLQQVMTNLNDIVWDNAMGERYITCFLAKYNRETRALEYVNAAHPAGVLVHKGKSIELGQGCVGIGMFEKIPTMVQGVETIVPGTLFLCFTDGISETENAKEEQFQQKEMMKTFSAAERLSIEEVNAFIIRQLDGFRGKNSYNDDVALVSCRFV
ncbi:MAG: SpoIIE family protein phosphatase [Flavobacteriales bacterium]|nr:SpoIIE family protein phosphatase [Flavobacteriales bacterium]